MKIEMVDLSKQYDKQSKKVIKSFNLQVESKEFIVIVGPSGCGKSTLLRMIAGLEDITSGELRMDNKRVNEKSPNERDIAMVFQNYALYPHLTVFDNIAFGLNIRKVKKQKIQEQVEEASSVLGLSELLKRKPKELSGGQKQRVALGRAIVRNAGIFLMDEPLSNLDAKLRVHMREEITQLHHKLGSTTIYVTHDQTEAMTMASRIVVLNNGHIQQIGTPKEIYNHPKNIFVASFIGSPPINLLKGTLNKNQLELTDGTVLINDLTEYEQHHSVIIGVRPENIQLTDDTGIKMKVTFTEMMGADLHVYGELAHEKIVIRVSANQEIEADQFIYLRFSKTKIHLFDSETEEVLTPNQELIECVV